MFQTHRGRRPTPIVLGLMFKRLSARSGVHVTAHALRRTFTILALRAGVDVAHLQALTGRADTTMLMHYAQMGDVDLIQAHSEHSPIDWPSP